MLMLSAWPLYELYMIILKQCFYTRCWRKIRIVLFLIWVNGSFREAENKKWFLDYDIVPCNSTNRNSMGDLHNMKTKMAELKTPEKNVRKIFCTGEMNYYLYTNWTASPLVKFTADAKQILSFQIMSFQLTLINIYQVKVD